MSRTLLFIGKLFLVELSCSGEHCGNGTPL